MVAKVHSLGPHTSVDVDQLALRVTLDVIGLVGVEANLVFRGGGVLPGEWVKLTLAVAGDPGRHWPGG